MQEKELRRMLSVNLEPSSIIDARMEEAYQMIRKAERKPESAKNPFVRRLLVGMGSVAAVFVLMAAFCVTNPVLAKEIPIVGGIFNKMSELFSFGQIPEKETVILFQEENKTANQTSKGGDAMEQSTGNTAAYQKTSGNLTVTLTEQYATNQAVFIGINIKNTQEFAKMAVFTDGTQTMSLETREQYSFRDDAIPAWRYAEGKFTDAHTFEGIIRIDYSEINVDDRKYQEAVKNADEEGRPIIDDSTYSQYMEEYEIPETFTMKLDITNVVGDLDEPLPLEEEKSQEELERMNDEEWQAYMKTLPQEWYDYPNRYQNWWQEGDWSYELTITKKDSASHVIEVNKTNSAGIGIKSIELSAVEMTLNTIEGGDTIAVALDADGNKIENGSSNVYELAIAGHDISKVYIYICDWDEYMDEIKGYGVSGNQHDKSFQEVLEERALFKTVVETGE